MIRLSIFLTICCLTAPCVAFGQKSLQGLDRIKPHPRILLLEGDEQRVRGKLSSDATYTFLHNIILKECAALLTTPPLGRELVGRRLLTTARESRRRIFYLSYAYRVTGDERYFRRAERELLAAASFADWNPSHFLDVAEMTMGVAIGYDWLYHSLPESSRQILEKAILTKGLQPSLLPENTKLWLSASHNWNQVCNASITYGAIALLDKYPDLCQKLIERSVGSVVRAMDEYLPDGGYPEGYGYWAYGTSFNVMMISALEKAFDSDFGLAAHNGFLKTGYYLLHMAGPSGLPFNYSDCDGKSLLNPAMGWFASRLKDPSLMTVERRIMEEQKTHLHRIRELPALMVWGLDFDFSRVPQPASLVWVGQGKTPVALLRSSWSPDSAIYVGLKGGSASTTHSHMDAGSFVMDALGERWAMDFGPQDYNSLESKGVKLWHMNQESDRWKVFRITNLSHNTLSFNKGPQIVEGRVPIVASTDVASFRSAVADLTPVYAHDVHKAERGVAIVENKYVVIRDELETKKHTSIRWNMLTDADVTIIDSRTAELRKKGKRLLLRVNAPSDAVLTTWSTMPTTPYDAPNPGTVFLGFEVNRKPGENVAFEVLLIPADTSMENKMAIPVLSGWPLLNSTK